jgi:DNA polymerase-4
MQAPATGEHRKIIHSDCDCFYAAIEVRDQPSLLGRPVAVGGAAHERGVVASCNYEARATGVRSAMPMALAQKRCPDLVVIRPAMDKYRGVSRQIFEIYRSFTQLVEPLSLDEAFLDVSRSPHHRGSATLMARAIKARVRAEVGITVSTGVAPNKFLAKIASAWRKPDGLFVIEPRDVEAFVAALPVEKLFGVGAVTASKLHAAGFRTCADIASGSRLELRALTGILGDRLFELSRGIDTRPVVASRQRKSLSVETTYVRDLVDRAACQDALGKLVARLADATRRLDACESIDRIFVKIRFDNFKGTSVERAASSLDAERFCALLDEGLARGERPVRLLGVGARIVAAPAGSQLPLFDSAAAQTQSLQGKPT